MSAETITHFNALQQGGNGTPRDGQHLTFVCPFRDESWIPGDFPQCAALWNMGHRHTECDDPEGTPDTCKIAQVFVSLPPRETIYLDPESE